jgi:hypothetical protein
MAKGCRDCGDQIIGRAANAQLCVTCGAAAVARWEAYQAMSPEQQAEQKRIRCRDKMRELRARRKAQAGL